MGLLFLAVGRIGYDKIVAVAWIGYQRIPGLDERLFAADCRVGRGSWHTACNRAVNDVFSVEGLELEETLLVFVEAEILLDVIVSG